MKMRLSPFLLLATALYAQEPPNAPADLRVDGTQVTLNYAGKPIFTGRFSAPVRHSVELARGDRGTVEQIVRFSAAQPVELTGAVTASDEAFAAETYSAAQQRFPLIRNSVGPSANLRNNAVYDRRFDWVLYGPPDGGTRITPRNGAYQMTIRGRSIALTFKPRYYQKHRNIAFFEPWKYDVWKEPVAGWCSWWAYRTAISERLVADISTVFAKKLHDYGYDYIQIDDGYQSGLGLPERFLKTNERFPSGLEALARTIAGKGLKPAIWVSVGGVGDETAREHPDWLFQKPGAGPFKGPWIGYGTDGSNPAAIDALVRPLYRRLREMGWRYVKVDTLRHLLYDSAYPARDYLAAKGSTPETAFRNVFQAIGDELGPDVYLLACWGVLPETIGLANASRLGTDGFGPSTMAQYNSWNNVVWRNDPDHVDISVPGEEILRPVLVSMAGVQMMLSDKLEFYETGNLEGARRSAPVLFSLPGQLYDYDRTKSDNLLSGLRNATGGGPSGPLDADQRGVACPWWMLEINRPFESWTVLARLAWDPQPAATVRFRDLGLAGDRDYLVYEFWSKKFLGAFRGSFPVSAEQARETRVYAIREKLDRPQIVSTNRHITQGGPDLVRVEWRAAEKTLEGESGVVAGDPYAITVRVPVGFTLASAEIAGAAPAEQRSGELLTLTEMPAKTGRFAWRVRFR